MSVGNIGLQFGVNSVAVKKNYDMRIHVKENFNYLRYSTQFGNANTGVAFVDSDPITVSNNIIVKDLTASILENSPRVYSEQIFNDQSFTLNYGKFLISDVFKATSLNEEVPLYYWHDLSDYNSISNVEILDGNFEKINPDKYLYIDEEPTLGEVRKGVYTNIKSEHNASENYYTIYYIKFKDLTTDAFVTELLNPKPFYELVDFDVTSKTRAYNINSSTGTIADINVYFDSKTYSPTPVTDSHRFSVKITGEKRINVIKPVDAPSSKKWNLRISPGQFYKNIGPNIGKYYIPEYYNQIFSPVAPYKLAVEKEAQIFTDKLLYLDLKPIANINISGFFIYIILKDNKGRIKKALTNDPNAGVYITPEGVTTTTFYEKDSIQSVAEDDGFVRLSTTINTDLNAFVTYRYIEDYYTYDDLQVNSTMNPDILDKRIVIYIRPEVDTNYSKNVHHLLVDEDDNIIDANQSTDYTTIKSKTMGGGINWLEDPSLDPNNNYTGHELEILSGANAGRSLQITSKTVQNCTVTVGDVVLTADSYGTKYNDYTLSFVDGASQGNESVSVDRMGIQVQIESGVSTAADIVSALNSSSLTSDLTASTTDPLESQFEGSVVGFSNANIIISVSHNYNDEIIDGVDYRINKKLNSYNKVDTQTATTFNYDGWLTEYLSAPNYYVLLADVFAVRTLVPSKIDTADIRIRGGGINKEEVDKALRLQDEAQWYWDVGYWDGQPYPGMGAILVNLPRSILKEVGGEFTREQVKDVVQRHMAEGTYPLIRYYDKSTKILLVEPSDKKIKLVWEDIKASSYNIYYGKNPDNLVLFKSAAGIQKEITVTGLENNKIYYFRVEAVAGGVPSLPSRIAYAIPFNFSSVRAPAIYGETVYSEGTYSL